MRFWLLTLILALQFSSLPSHAGSCSEWLMNAVFARTPLTKRVENLEASLEQLILKDIDKIKIVDFLGYGFSGYTLKVEIEGRAYALKMFYTVRPSTRLRSEIYQTELTESVLIQQFFGELGLAPQIHGIIERNELRALLSKQNDSYRRILAQNYIAHTELFRAGLLMELTDGVSGKDDEQRHFKIHEITPEQKASLIKQARYIDNMLHRYHVLASDVDLVIREDGRLQLIDLSFYRLSQSRMVHSLNQIVEITLERFFKNEKLIRLK